MTTYSPAAIRDMAKKIAYKAIETDLYLLPAGSGGGGWEGSADDGFYGIGWEGRLPPVTGPTGPTRLKWFVGGMGMVSAMLPGMTKVGEGYNEAAQGYIEYEIDAWASIYEPWVTRIEQAFQGWDDIPEPGDFDGPVQSLRDAVSAITPIGSSAGKDGDFTSSYSNVDLASALGTIQTVVGEFVPEDSGLLLYTFIENYGPVRTREVMNNQGQVAIVLGVSMLAEQKIWQGAQLDIMAIADKAYESMRPGGAGGDAINFEIVKAFVDVVKNFVPGAVSTAIDAGESVIDLVNTVAPKPPEGDSSVELTGWSCDEVASSMEDLIGKLDKKVFDSEYEIINTTLTKTLDYMWGNDASQFHLDPDAGVQPDLVNAKSIKVHPESLKKVGYQLVPRVAAFMGHAADYAQQADKLSIWSRSKVGYVFGGPYNKWVEVLNEFDKVTTGSGRELVEAGRLLAVGAGWLEDTDGSSQAELAGVNEDLNRGSDGWDNRPPPPPPTYETLPNGKRIPI